MIEPHDLTPDPTAWPSCSECHQPWVLRRTITVNSGYQWLWMRDCKHKRAEPVVSTAEAAP